MPIPKPGGGHRELARLDPKDDLAYRRAVAPLTPRIERSLGPGVLASRAVGRGALVGTRLEPWERAWGRWLRSFEPVARVDRAWIVRADVADCYGSMGDTTLRRALGAEVDDVLAMLRQLWDEGVSGLPIGPDPSAIMANGVLAAVDREIRLEGGIAFRWVDDWIVGVPSHRTAGRVLRALEHTLDRLELELNPGKTRVYRAAGPDEPLVAGASAVRRPPRGMMPAP